MDSFGLKVEDVVGEFTPLETASLEAGDGGFSEAVEGGGDGGGDEFVVGVGEGDGARFFWVASEVGGEVVRVFTFGGQDGIGVVEVRVEGVASFGVIDEGEESVQEGGGGR